MTGIAQAEQVVPLEAAGGIVRDLAATMLDNRAYLSEIDGATGDGDHGINMSKGFSLAAAALGEKPLGLAPAFHTLGRVLLDEIGGSMGPLYGMFFLDMADTIEGHVMLDPALFDTMLSAGIAAVAEMGGAAIGDKSLMDTLIPARDAFRAAKARGAGFGDSLTAMVQAAEAGKESTRDMIARIGRASRLGERSRGVLDAGATSSFLILQTTASGLAGRLRD